MSDLSRIVEALLFAADGPLTAAQICEAVPEANEAEIDAAMAELQGFYDDTQRGFYLTRLSGGHQLLTRPALAPWVEKLLLGRRRQRLSRAGLEVLAVVAYRQPVTRGEIESVRGVDCGASLRTLLERKLIAIRGRARAVGHPLLYATTDRFLEHFGIAGLAELPKLDEFAALVDREAARAEVRESGAAAASEAATPPVSERTGAGADEASGETDMPGERADEASAETEMPGERADEASAETEMPGEDAGEAPTEEPGARDADSEPGIPEELASPGAAN